MDWTKFRDAFPVTRRWAFLDHAAVAPLPTPAVQALADYAADLSENGGVGVGRRVRQIEEVRGAVGKLLNCDPLDVAFVPNTSAGLGLLAEGFPWQPGDNVVTAAEEYPANQYPWLNLHDRGVTVRRVPSRGSRVILDDLREAIDERTRVLTISFIEFASGYRNDLDALGELCRERGVTFCVDAIQGLGAFPLDVQKTPIDFLAADGHKWLLGPEGAGVVYVRRELLEQLHPVGVGWNSVVNAADFSTVDFTLKPDASRWEGGSPNVAGLFALGASLRLLLEAGIPAIAERILALTDYLCDGAERAGWEVFSSRRPGEASGIVSLVVPDADSAALMRHCRDAGIAVNQRAGRLRLSPHAYNTPDEIDRFLDCVKSCPRGPAA